MKIYCIANLGFGAARYIIDNFCKKGHEIYVFNTGKNSLECCKMVYPLRRTFINLIISPFVIKRHLLKIKPDIFLIIGVDEKALLAYLAIFLPLYKLPNIKLVGLTGGSDIMRRYIFPFYVRAVQKFFFKKIDLININDSRMKKVLKNNGVTEDKISQIPYGINIEKFYKDKSDDIYNLKRALNIEKSDKVVGLVSGFEYYMGVEYFIKSIPLILKKIPNTRFLIIGDGSLKTQLLKLVDELHIQDKVIFTGRLPYEKMRLYYNIMDIFVLASTECAGVSLALLEAMACELSVIVTDTGEYKKVVKDGYNGYVVPIKDIKILANRIIALLENNELRNLFGVRGRKIVETFGNIVDNIEKLETVIHKLICTVNNN